MCSENQGSDLQGQDKIAIMTNTPASMQLPAMAARSLFGLTLLRTHLEAGSNLGR